MRRTGNNYSSSARWAFGPRRKHSRLTKADLLRHLDADHGKQLKPEQAPADWLDAYHYRLHQEDEVPMHRDASHERS